MQQKCDIKIKNVIEIISILLYYLNKKSNRQYVRNARCAMREFTGFKKGINLGGWLSQCGEGNYNDEHYSTFITAEDIGKIAEMGVDHIRLPIDYNVVMTDSGGFIPSGFSYVDWCIAQCKSHGLNIVLDLHKTAGFVFDDNCSDFFTDKRLQKMFTDLWVEFAKRYGGEDNVVFELLNEVTFPSVAQKWNEIAAETIRAVRGVSETVRIIIGGIENGSIKGLSLLDKPYDENIVFTFHCYSPLAFTHQKAYWVSQLPPDFECAYPVAEKYIAEKSREYLGGQFDYEFDENNSGNIGVDYFVRMFSKAIEVAEKWNVPLYCGEYGVIDMVDPQSTLNWFADIHAAFEKLDISRCVWTYKEKDFGITGGHYSGIYSTLVTFL